MIHRHALTRIAELEIAGFQFRNVSAAAKHGFNISVFFGECDGVINISLDSHKRRKVAINKFFRLKVRNTGACRHAKSAHAKENAKVDCFCGAAHFFGYFGHRHVMNGRGGCRVNVLPGFERGNHFFIVCKMRGDAEFHL